MLIYAISFLTSFTLTINISSYSLFAQFFSFLCVPIGWLIHSSALNCAISVRCSFTVCKLKWVVVCFVLQWYCLIDHVGANLDSRAEGWECNPILAGPPGTARLGSGSELQSLEHSCSLCHWCVCAVYFTNISSVCFHVQQDLRNVGDIICY